MYEVNQEEEADTIIIARVVKNRGESNVGTMSKGPTRPN